MSDDLDAQGFWPPAQRLDSPNQDPRPTDVTLDLVVVHNISLPPDQFGGQFVQQLFTNCLDPRAHPYFAQIASLRVSAHFLIDRRGQATQFVSTHCRAWHAGVSMLEVAGLRRTACNDFSIGIELEGTDTAGFTAAQYRTLGRLGRALHAAHSIRYWRGHSEIAPGRKTDPGPSFDWQRAERAYPAIGQSR